MENMSENSTERCKMYICFKRLEIFGEELLHSKQHTAHQNIATKIIPCSMVSFSLKTVLFMNLEKSFSYYNTHIYENLNTPWSRHGTKQKNLNDLSVLYLHGYFKFCAHFSTRNTEWKKIQVIRFSYSVMWRRKKKLQRTLYSIICLKICNDFQVKKHIVPKWNSKLFSRFETNDKDSQNSVFNPGQGVFKGKFLRTIILMK